MFFNIGLTPPITKEVDEVSQRGWRKEEDGFVIRRRTWFYPQDR